MQQDKLEAGNSGGIGRARRKAGARIRLHPTCLATMPVPTQPEQVWVSGRSYVPTNEG